VSIDAHQFDRFAATIKALSGLVVPRDQLPFVEARLQPVVRRAELATAEDLLSRIVEGRDPGLTQAVVEALAVCETCFFRDKTPFDTLQREVLPSLAAARGDRPIRVWSAGCATGQEAYSVALLADQPGFGAPRLEIVGSDLSERCLEKASSGLYTQFEVQRGLPIRMLIEGFDQVDDMWRVSPRLRQSVTWRRFNLMHDPEPLGQFDVILCRNVLSAFDEETRGAVLARLASALAGDGRLLLGLSETVHGLSDAFRPVAGRRGLYVRKAEAERQVA
jgi:chemotaxis protein methyltransferase CheR